MALSNIIREPRREITESVVGLTMFGGVVGLDYYFALWFSDAMAATSMGSCPVFLGMMLGLMGGILIVFLAFITHALGDGICNALERNGIQLRPRNRP